MKSYEKALSHYPKHLKADWASWLYENYHAELPHLRPVIFQDILRRLNAQTY